MKLVAFFISLHFLLFANGCLKTRTCTCREFLELMQEPRNVLYTPHEKCVHNATCVRDFETYLYGSWTEIPRPEDSTTDYLWVDSGYTGEFINLQEHFGIYCDNGDWYATKYPEGVSYPIGDGDYRYLGNASIFAGLRTRIWSGRCRVLPDEYYSTTSTP